MRYNFSSVNPKQRQIKRTFDIVFGSMGLIFASPLMVFSALMIILDDGWPVLFSQKRVGENGRLFEMIKFRTMVKKAEQLRNIEERVDGDGYLASVVNDDPRVTRVGRFLRQFKLDELPQFINVLSNDMSLVGPRPELPHLIQKYEPWQQKRLAVPQGITGWWQVGSNRQKPLQFHIEDDLYYIEHFSLWLDIKILLNTIWIILRG